MQTSSFNIKQPIRTVVLQDLKIGGDTSFHFLSENENKSNPILVLQLNIFDTNEIPDVVKEYYKSSIDNKLDLVKYAQEINCDILALKFNIKSVEEVENAKKLLQTLLPVIKKPLMVLGTGDNDIDIKLLPELIKTLDRISIISYVEEKTYKQIVPSLLNTEHIIVIRTPIDINLAKEMNILTTDMGINPDKIIMDTDMGALGYGLDYGYSIMERIKLAGFDGDKMLNMPLIAFVGEETFKTKEAKSDSFDKNWGCLNERAVMFETATASAMIAAGSNLVVLMHPESIITLKGLI